MKTLSWIVIATMTVVYTVVVLPPVPAFAGDEDESATEEDGGLLSKGKKAYETYKAGKEATEKVEKVRSGARIKLAQFRQNAWHFVVTPDWLQRYAISFLLLWACWFLGFFLVIQGYQEGKSRAWCAWWFLGAFVGSWLIMKGCVMLIDLQPVIGWLVTVIAFAPIVVLGAIMIAHRRIQVGKAIAEAIERRDWKHLFSFRYEPLLGPRPAPQQPPGPPPQRPAPPPTPPTSAPPATAPATAPMATCPQCGQPWAPGARFC
ncbi:hypothetical protein KJ965_04805, partial [Patescibacteria group bacterium]|nr:hypothetical protein [Patescibacteria group bacterium]